VDAGDKGATAQPAEQSQGQAGVRVLPFALLLLSSCASNGSGHYLLVTDTHHGPMVWHKFQTAAACEEAKKGSDPELVARCTTSEDLHSN